MDCETRTHDWERGELESNEALYYLPLNASVTACLCPFLSHVPTTMNAQASMPH